jgi:protein-S-isoprenylcysteine O-methyltransferase Ste14
MDSVRYYLALIIVVTFPPGILFWFIVHPMIHFWRRLGTILTYVVVGLISLVIAWGLLLVRGPLLSTQFGTSYWLWIPAILLYIGAIWVEVQCRRHLKLRILVGIPELKPDASGGKVLTEGIYSKIRHPRYVAIMLTLLAWALVVNYLTVYLLCPLMWLGLIIVVRMEEKELLERFGEDYRRYSMAVPRFVPRTFGRQ